MATSRLTRRALLGAIGLLLSQPLSTAIPAQNPRAATAPATVSGTIVDSTGAPVYYAVVTVEGLALRTTTDSAGRFRLEPVPPGDRILSVRALGYQAATLGIALKPGQEYDQRLALRRVNVNLTELTVLGRPEPPGRLAGFYQRKQMGFGKFLTRDDIDRRPTNDVRDLFFGMAGVQIRSVNGTPWVVFPRCGRFAVFLDGQRLHGDPNELLSEFNPHDLEAVEIYRGPSELPAEFMENNCAAVVLWSRTG